MTRKYPLMRNNIPRGDLDAVNAAAELLAKAERPVIIAGDCVAQSRGHKELAALASMHATEKGRRFMAGRKGRGCHGA